MSNRVLTAASLLAALAGSAMAAPQGDELPVGTGLRELKQAPRGGRILDTNTQGAEQTTLQLIYEIAGPTDAGVPSGTLFGSGGSPRVFDVGTLRSDAGFSTTPAVASAFGYGWNTPGSGATPVNNFDILFRFYSNPNEGTSTSNSATNAPFYSGLFATLRVPDICPDPGFVTWFPTPVQLTDSNSNVVTVTFRDPATSAPVTKFGYETNIYEVGSSSVFNTRVNNFRMGGTLQPRVGTNDFRGWAFGLGSTAGAGSLPWAAGDNTRELFQREANGTAANRRDSYLKMWAQLPANIVPPTATDVGTVSCASNVFYAATAQISLSASGGRLGQWFKFTLPVDVSSPNENFLDIAVEIDPNFGDNVSTSFGLFAGNGNRVLTDFRRGDFSLYPAATFGHGRRPGNGGIDERDRVFDRDGRDGPLGAGSYYIFVSGQEARYGGTSFAVDPSLSTAEGNAILRFDTNANAGGNCPLPAPVAPTIRRNLGDIGAGTITTVNDLLTGVRAITWYKFTTTFDINPGNTNFLDIHNVGSELGGSAMSLYDGNGVAVGGATAPVTSFADDDTGGLYAGTNIQCPPTDTRAQLSYGASSVPRPALGPGAPFAGQNGDTLPAGDYYLALALDNLFVRNIGWQSRSDSGSYVFMWVTLRTPFQCSADYNRDGFLNLDDVGDFITDFYTLPAIPGGLQPNAPSYSDNALIGFGVGCPNAGAAPAPYDIDAYRSFGYRVGYSSDGSNTCPFDPSQPFPNLDNLNDYITGYYTAFGTAECSG